MTSGMIGIAAALTAFHAFLISLIADEIMKKHSRQSQQLLSQIDKMEKHLDSLVRRLSAVEMLLHSDKNRQ